MKLYIKNNILFECLNNGILNNLNFIFLKLYNKF